MKPKLYLGIWDAGQHQWVQEPNGYVMHWELEDVVLARAACLFVQYGLVKVIGPDGKPLPLESVEVKQDESI